ncbi:MAG: lycopene cyclase domain-containing protein [Rhodothermaceae bacterium]|nr:lycopene cyclase domain-containing protein [Rhodothermaceae bacterium]
MTYLQFHAAFTLPALAALWIFRPRRVPAWWPLVALVVIAFVYTTPWDNYLVAQRVWTYPADRVLATVGHVPVEEYAFFVIQTVMTGLLFIFVRARYFLAVPAPASRHVRLPGTVLFGALALTGWLLTALGGRGLYLGLVLGWACPVLAGMWAFGGDMLWARRRLIAWAVAVPTLYLCIADRIAIALDIWHISEATSTGVMILGLPIEEALFFFVTNLMIVQGFALSEPSPASPIPALRRLALAKA